MKRPLETLASITIILVVTLVCAFQTYYAIEKTVNVLESTNARLDRENADLRDIIRGFK